MLTVSLTDEFLTVALSNKDAELATEAVELCYSALLAMSFAPQNIAEAFAEVGEQHCEALGLNDDNDEADREWVDFRAEMVKEWSVFDDEYV
jgi:hypothetical protein